jgi:hypothetical protein
MMAICGWLFVTSVVDRAENTIFHILYDLVQKRHSFVSTIDHITAIAQAIVTLILRQDAWNTVLGNMSHVQVIRYASPSAAGTSSTVTEQLARTNFATFWILN